MRFRAPIELRVSNILARVVLFNACALAIDHDTVRQAHLADCTFCDSVLRRFVFGAVTVVSTYDKVCPSHEHELSETEQPDVSGG